MPISVVSCIFGLMVGYALCMIIDLRSKRKFVDSIDKIVIDGRINGLEIEISRFEAIRNLITTANETNDKELMGSAINLLGEFVKENEVSIKEAKSKLETKKGA